MSAKLRLLPASLGAMLLLAGCAMPDLRLVSKPAMQFSETRSYATQPAMQFGEVRGYAASWRMASQLEPGRLVTGGAQASVCAYCR